jgi:hypothetical protein
LSFGVECVSIYVMPLCYRHNLGKPERWAEKQDGLEG